MDPFTTAFLSKLASDLSVKMLSAAGRRLRNAIGLGEKKLAFERCVKAGVTAAVSRARVDSVEQKQLAEDIFTEFFNDEYTAPELIGLMSAKAPDMTELRESFRNAGYVPDQVPGLDFRQAAEAFKAGFVDAAIHEPLLQPIILTNESIKQTDELVKSTQVNEQILEELQGLSDFMRNHAFSITIQNCVILAQDPRTLQILPFSPSKTGAASGDWESFYLERLVNHCNQLDLTELDERCVSSDSARKSVKISDVFTTLDLEDIRRTPDQSVKDAILKPASERAGEELSGKGMARIGDSDPDEKQEQVPIQAAEACGALRRIVILGRPGGGKSTLVNHLAVSLARKRRGEEIADEGDVLSGWEPNSRTLLPARIVLRRFAAWVPDPAPRPSEGLIWEYLEHMLKDWSCPKFVDEMKQTVHDQGGVFFFDGLDEVGHGDENSKRTLILETIEKFAKSFPKCRIVVTCREYAYREKKGPGKQQMSEQRSWRLTTSEFPPVKLALFHPEQIRSFTRAWYETTGKWKGWDETTRQSGAEELYNAVVGTRNLLELGQYPLLLTLMAQVHGRDGYLPQDRADLYDRVVVLLLALWEARVAKESGDACQLAPDMAPGLNIRVDKLRKVLEQAALAAHEKQEQQQGERKGCADVAREDLRELLVTEADCDWNQAEDAIRYMEQRSGLILAHDNRTFAFPHRTFQEYLTATAIVKSIDDYEVYLRDCLVRDLDWWREVFLLAAGYCRERAKDIFNLVEVLLPNGPDSPEMEMTEENAAFACLAAQAMGETRFSELASTDKGKKDGRFRKILDRVRDWLLAAMQADQILTAKQRCDAGDYLNYIGDPRFDQECWYLPVGEDRGFIEIPAGMFWMGSDKKRDPDAYEDEFPRHEVRLSEYCIGAYPVTVAQYRAYLNHERVKPDNRWKNENKYDNRPVVLVSWHDAQKYCEWLTGRLRETGRNVRAALPTEAQWERAARSEEYSIYPWGDDANPNKFNHGGTGIGSASPVGCFLSGKSPFGLKEMSGNVLEWCEDCCELKGDKIVTDTYKDGMEDPVCREGSLRVLRGGSWGYVAADCRTAYRFVIDPTFRILDFGFRLVLLECRQGR